MILEGRFGNSIRFGSSNPRGKNNWSENDSEGDPITIISNGQSGDKSISIENINGDASSIYLTSNQNINNINIISKNFKSLNASFSEPESGLDPLSSFTTTNNSVVELLNSLSDQGIDSNFPSQPNEIIEGIQPPDIPGDDGGSIAVDNDTSTVGNKENIGLEDLTKIPGKYIDNNRVPRELFILPKRFTTSTVLVTSVLAVPLMRMLNKAEEEGVKVIVNSGFRPPVDDIYLNNKLIQISQKTVRLKNLKSKYKNKLKEPWLLSTTVIEPFDGYQVGDSYAVSPQSRHFDPLTAPSFGSAHGRSLACDFSTASATSDGYKWLCKEGWKYGFIRTVKSEPWHFGYLPEKAKNGPTALLPYIYEPGRSYRDTTNRWNNVFGSIENNWNQEYISFQEQQAQELNA